jgi:hypothetical protein
MIYFVMAQQKESEQWDNFGPWDDVEIADGEIAKLDDDALYSRVELARVLTDEESTEWLRDPPSKPHFIEYPDHWPSYYNGNSEPCDMIEGPCGCGAWHTMDENWVKEMIGKHGLPEE